MLFYFQGSDAYKQFSHFFFFLQLYNCSKMANLVPVFLPQPKIEVLFPLFENHTIQLSDIFPLLAKLPTNLHDISPKSSKTLSPGLLDSIIHWCYDQI